MKLNIDNIFQELEARTETEFDKKVNKFNELYAKEKALVFKDKPRKVKAEVHLNNIRKIIKELDKENIGEDYYEDFLKFAIKTTGNTKWETFPPLTKIVKRVGHFKKVLKNNEIYKFVFWPCTTTNTGVIYDQATDTYYGFPSKSILENIKGSLEFLVVKENLYTPYKKGTLKHVTKEQFLFLEILLVSMIRHRKEWGDLIPKIFTLWKKVKELPIKEEKYIPFKVKGKEDDGMIYEI